jgi:hypothetical protein
MAEQVVRLDHLWQTLPDTSQLKSEFAPPAGPAPGFTTAVVTAAAGQFLLFGGSVTVGLFVLLAAGVVTSIASCHIDRAQRDRGRWAAQLFCRNCGHRFTAQDGAAPWPERRAPPPIAARSRALTPRQPRSPFHGGAREAAMRTTTDIRRRMRASTGPTDCSAKERFPCPTTWMICFATRSSTSAASSTPTKPTPR